MGAAPLLDEALVPVGEQEVDLAAAVGAALFVVDESRQRSQLLRLLRVARVLEVHLAVRAAEPPRRHVPGAGGLVRRLVGDKRDPVVAGPNLGVVGAVGADATPQ